MVEKNIINSSLDKRKYVGSISFLIFIILLTGILFGYNKYLIKGNTELETKKSDLQLSIDEVEKDNIFVVYSLIEANKKVLDIFAQRSKITNYINHIEEIGEKYGLTFRGFNFSSSEIKTSIVLESDDNGVAYKKLINFISDYRSDDKALFKLDYINRVLGYDDMKVNIGFQIK